MSGLNWIGSKVRSAAAAGAIVRTLGWILASAWRVASLGVK